MHKRIALRKILKFTLKQLLHVAVNHHHQGAYYLSLLKLQLLKYIGVVNSVVWLHISLGPQPIPDSAHTYTNKDLMIHAVTLPN